MRIHFPAVFRAVFLGACFATLASGLRAGVVLNEVVAGASERLLQWDGNGVPRLGAGVRWQDAGFGDAAWASGAGPFGFGTLTNTPPTPVATNLGAAMQFFTPGLYLRRAFNVSAGDAARSDPLELVVEYNDGFVAYLNGVEIARRNGGPAGKFIYHDQPAYNREVFSDTAPIPTTTTAETITIPQTAPLLVAGNNVLAIHALNASADDATFYNKASLRISGAPVVTLVNHSDAWKFLVGVVEPSGGLFDPALLASGRLSVPWGRLTFDDSAWSGGVGPIGAGSPGIALGTSLTAQVINVTPSVYMRVAFTVSAAEAAETQALQLIVRSDDGFVAYLNGVEVVRRKIGTPNTFTPRTAVADAENSATVAETIALESPAKLLVSGSNVLAIQVHNFAVSNTDLAMKADLKTTGPSNRTVVANNTTWKYRVGTAEPVTPGTATPSGPDAVADWIELRNSGASDVSLNGWSLTDDSGDPQKWMFPNVSIPAGGFLVVVADKLDLKSNPGGFLHANFALDRDGNYVGLFDAAHALVDQIAPKFPRQSPFHSYARDGAGAFRFSDAPSPGAANGGNFFDGIVSAPTVDHAGRFYPGSITVALSCATAGATIRYTTDGTEPTASSPAATGALAINVSTALRARAFRSGWVASPTITHTYLIAQSAARQTLPAVCLTGDPQRDLYRPFGIMAIVGGRFFEDSGGVWDQYTGGLNPDPVAYNAAMQSGAPAERALALEILHAGATSDLRIDAGVRPAGSPYSRPRYVLTDQNSANPNGASPWIPNDPREKPQFNVFFRDDLAGKPLDYPLVPGSGVGSYDTIRLRSGSNDVSNPFIRDEFTRRLYLDMGQVGVRGDFVNLYVNAVFKGYYNIAERPREKFFQQARGTASSFDVRNIEDITDGDAFACNELISYARTHAMTGLANYQGMAARLDVVNFADYLCLNVVAAMIDWPDNNYVMDRERAPGGLFRFTVWDAEGGFGGFGADPHQKTFGDLITGSLMSDPVPIRVFYTQLKQSPEWRLLFADRIQKHLFNNGALTDANLTARYNLLRGQILPMIQDVFGAATPFDEFLGLWLNGAGNPTRYTLANGALVNCPSRRAALFTGYDDDTAGGAHVAGYFISEGLWPATLAPVPTPFGGTVATGAQITIANPNASGSIYFTTDGSDPRAPGGAVAGALYAGGVTVAQPIVVKARVLNTNGEWSPLAEAAFSTSTAPPLLITEIMYHPPPLNGIDGDEYEFIELKNAGAATLNLNGMAFTGGIEFTFPAGSMLAPGAFLVLAENAVRFHEKYGANISVFGSYGPGTSLANSGESIVLRDAGGNVVASVAYGDAPPWPSVQVDGGGYSLVPVLPNANPDPGNGVNWRASANPGGSPGADDPAPVSAPVFINELLANPAAAQTDAVELFNPTAAPVNVGDWWLSDTILTPKKYRIPANTIVPAGGWLVISGPAFGASFEFPRTGGTVVLSVGDAGGNLLGIADAHDFGASDPGVSFGLLVNSTGARLLVAQSALTLGAANSGPLTGPVVISEIMYGAAAGGDDFIEVRNISGAPVALCDPANPANTWRVNGVGFSFPQNTVLAPRQIALVSPLPPASFRAAHGVPDAVAVFQYSGSLSDAGERVALEKPAAPVGGQPLSYIEVDAVTYGIAAPWPSSPNHGGPSLERIHWRAFADDAANWRASGAGGTPGRMPVVAFAGWQNLHFTAAQIAELNFGGADADPDHDGLGNFWEFALGLDPLSADAAGAITTSLANDGANGPFLTLRFRRNPSAQSLQYHVDTAADLPAWNLDGSIPVGAPLPNGDGTETVTMRDTLAPAAALRRFIRLRLIGN